MVLKIHIIGNTSINLQKLYFVAFCNLKWTIKADCSLQKIEQNKYSSIANLIFYEY